MDNVAIRCVGFLDQEDGKWHAVALDLDLVAEGDSPEQAQAELLELINMQISFAAKRNDLSGIWRRAPDIYWEMYDRIRAQHTAAMLGQAHEAPTESVSDLPFPDAHVIKKLQAQFT